MLSRSSETPFRLHCEELTGQTDLDDSIRRQRLFQDVMLEEDNRVVDPVDLLSVTTTMEAGIDIGGLQVVMMSNMPPQRFNYQQRVGRAGRRGDPLAIALTVCRGRTHDDFYFRNPERITGDLPPQPYIDLSRLQIVRRVVAAEAMRLAFTAARVVSTDSEGIAADLGNSPHGQFGSVAAWETHRTRVRDWLASAEAEPLLARAVDALLLEVPPPLGVPEQRDGLLHYARLELVDAVDQALSSGPAFQDQLGELLANKGVLPMFGFPTRSRLLYQRRPTTRDWPPTKNVIDRDLDIAITQFAPGAQTVKDKAVFTSVGVVGYERRGQWVNAIADPLGSPANAGLCRRCHALTTQEVDNCPVCGEPVGGEFGMHQISEPPGFRTDYQEGKPFKGNFEWAPGASRARVSESDPIAAAVALRGMGLTIRKGSSRIYSINDNEGRDYEFRRDPGGHGWVVPEAYGENPPPNVAPQQTLVRALASITTTDVLFLGLERAPSLAGLNLSPATVPGRASWYSFGFLLRSAAARLLDIDPRELRVGLRVFREAEAARAEVFLSDDLDNGAGYSTYLAEEDVMRALFEMIGPEAKEGTIAAQWSVHAQAGKLCDSSCHDCLRDYSNMPFHPLLDWRLALDMADLASGRALPEQRWLVRAAGAQNQLCEGFGFKAETFGGIPALLREDEKIVQLLTHPLWDTDTRSMGLTLARSHEEALRAYPDHRLAFANLFDAVHRPAYILDTA